MTWTLVMPPTVEPVSVVDLREQSKIGYADEDATIGRFIAAARSWVEHYTSRALMTQTWRAALPWFADRIWLPRAAPVQVDGVSVAYYDAANASQVLAADRYVVYGDGEPASIALAPNQQWPTTIERLDAVRITYACGVDDPASVPADLRQAIVLLAAHWYLTREATAAESMDEAPFAVTALCAPHRVGTREYAMAT
jgi:uncharacterized phiE125 gp8 family phage protein